MTDIVAVEPDLQPWLGGDGFREKVMHLEAFIHSREDKLSPTDCPVRHIFAPGAYAREVTLPKGAVVIGKIHRSAHLNVISAGKIHVVTENGAVEITAPYSFVSEVGVKRVGYVLEETVWTTFHVTDETDPEKIEDAIIAKSYEELSAPALRDER